jgi:tRNA(Ile)-lysidine synthase
VLARARDAGFEPADRIVVGFSGGRDSLALAAALRWAQRTLGIEALLVHVDHQLRKTSGEDARRAESLADALGMEFRAVAVAMTPIAVHPGVGVEEAARLERYRILFETAIQNRARAVATAHHQGDQAETVLLHLLRGGGVHGAAGMAERAAAPFHVPDPRGTSNISRELRVSEAHAAPWLWRPLLAEPREVITAYVQGIGLEPIEDPSNDDTTLRRNAVRHDVMPVLEHHFPQASAALARYAALAAEDDRALEDVALSALDEVIDPGGLLAATPLGEQPLAIQRRVIRGWLMKVTGSSALTAERTDAVLALARASQGGQSIEIGEGWTVRRERGMLRADKTGSRDEEGE